MSGQPPADPSGSTSHTVSRLSLTTFSTASTTAVGIARLVVPSTPAEVPLTPLAVLLVPLTTGAPLTPSLVGLDSLAFVDDEDVWVLFAVGLLDAAVAAAVSRRTSSSTLRMSAGNVLTSPDRSKASACDCTADGQFELCASREWRKRSWILRRKNMHVSLVLRSKRPRGCG